jgi:hypothetical protein
MILLLVDDSGLAVKPARTSFLQPPPRTLRNRALFLFVDHRPQQVDGQRIDSVNDKDIGVGDSREILGLEPDYALQRSRKDRDGFEQTLSQILINAFGEACFARFVKVSFCSIAGKEICLVRVAPARRPIFIAEEKGVQTMYVRAGNSTRPLSTPDAVAYATEHFGGFTLGWRSRRSRPVTA